MSIGGVLIQAEIAGQMTDVDWRPLPGEEILEEDFIKKDPSRALFRKFWQEYFNERNIYFKWNPKLRVSDMTEVWRHLDDEGKLLPRNCWNQSWEKEEGDSRETWNHIFEWIEIGAFSSLDDGLNDENRKSIANHMKTWFSKNTDINPSERCLITWEIRFLCHTKPDSPDWQTYKAINIYRMAMDFNNPESEESGSQFFRNDENFPVKNYNIDLPDKPQKRLQQFLDSIVIPALDEDYLDCEMVLWNFAAPTGESEWGSEYRCRPRFVNSRQKYIHEIAGTEDIFLYIYRSFKKTSFVIKCKNGEDPEPYPDLADLINTKDREEKQRINNSLNALIKKHRYFCSDEIPEVYVYYIPTKFKPGDESGASELGMGGLVIVREKPLDERLKTAIQQIVERELSPLGVCYLYNRQRLFARKNIVAAIMSRNFSHNVGSHVLANPKFYETLGHTRPKGC